MQIRTFSWSFSSVRILHDFEIILRYRYHHGGLCKEFTFIKDNQIILFFPNFIRQFSFILLNLFLFVLEGMSFPILKLLLVLTNFFLTSFLLILTCDHLYSHDDIQSWGFIFHVLSLSWLSIRGIFWLATIVPIVKWTTLSFYLLYWMPAPLEFAAFMLLPLYFTQILYPDEWKKHWNNVRPFYFSFIVGIILFQVLWTWLADSPEVMCIL